MSDKSAVSLSIAVALILLSACASSNSVQQSRHYPPTDEVAAIFQISQAPPSCKVFSHVFATMPANMRMSDFADKVTKEAKSKGADMMLIGHSRQCTTESALKYTYYGPDREYEVKEWPGWSFGFDEWSEQGDWASIGYNEWMDNTIHYDYPIVMQLVFLRCRQ